MQGNIMKDIGVFIPHGSGCALEFVLFLLINMPTSGFSVQLPACLSVR